MEEAVEEFNQHGPPEHAWQNVAATAKQERVETENEGYTKEQYQDSEELDDHANLIEQQNTGTPELSMRFETQTDASVMSNTEYYQCVRTMNQEQRKIFMNHRNWCKKVIEISRLKTTIKPYNLFLSGAGGVDKSHVIKLKHDTIKFMRHLPNVNHLHKQELRHSK